MSKATAKKLIPGVPPAMVGDTAPSAPSTRSKEAAVADEREILPPWTKAPCVSCGEEYQATRTEPGPVGECCECESYARGFEDGKKAAPAGRPAPSALDRARCGWCPDARWVR